MLLNLVKFSARMFYRIFYKVEIVGLDNIPQTGAVVFACNHVSNFDPPLVGGFVGLKRDPIYIVKKEIFSVPLLGPMLKSFGFIPVDRYRKGGDMQAIKRALKVIKEGKALFLFPEGTRSKTGKPIRPKAGIGFLLWHCQAPVVPIKEASRNPTDRMVQFTSGVAFRSPLMQIPPVVTNRAISSRIKGT